MDDFHCSFCGKRRREVRKLISGPRVFICDECVALCNDIIAKEEAAERPKYPRPREIYDELNRYVIGQDRAKKALSVSVLQPLQAHRPARQGGRGRDPEGQHPPARPHRLRQDAARADAGEEARRAVRHGGRDHADRGRLRRRGRRLRHQGALPQRRQRSREGQPRHRLHRRDRQDRAQGRRAVRHARRLGRGRPAGAAQDPRGQAGVDHARRRAQPPAAGADPGRHHRHPLRLHRRLQRRRGDRPPPRRRARARLRRAHRQGRGVEERPARA